MYRMRWKLYSTMVMNLTVYKTPILINLLTALVQIGRPSRSQDKK